ncbi:UNVERIFIED_CONTAM: ABC transporter B family member 19 [Sesamum angustifolium]|uniref:ABC transporter B family member 19 n=3 Tax=Sesamum TaxID=4181 RepID=A0AAW2LGR7_9LAMI
MRRCWMYASERQVTRLRLTFLKAVLSQEIGAFDTDLTSGKIISGISSHMSIIQDNWGKDISYHALATFISGVFDCFHFLLGSVTSSIICCPNDSCNWGYLYKENECYFSNKDVIPVGGYCNGRTARQLHMSKNEAFVKGFGTGMFQIVTFCSLGSYCFVGAIVCSSWEEHMEEMSLLQFMSILFWAMKETLILQGFTLSIPAGKVVALVGSSGCGKSTIMSLITRFYDPIKGTPKTCISFYQNHAFLDIFMDTSIKFYAYFSVTYKRARNSLYYVGKDSFKEKALLSLQSSGDILIDNHSIKDLDLKFLRRNIGLVSQEPSLFSGNIEDNIKAGNSNADDDQIQKAAQMANAHSFISQFPEQYLTEVGQRGVQLSGGQKQRIAIARAILKNPPILLLDEATSALDTESERVVQAALETAMQGRTVILIAHRLSTIVNADMIAVVENGIVTETGTHQDLLTNNKFYHNLFELQNINKKATQEDSMEEVASIQTDISSQFLDQPDEPREHYFFGVVGENAMTNLRRALYAAILRNELAWFEKPENSVGSITSRVINETSTVKTIISDRMSVIVQCISSIVIATIVSIKVNWRMGLVAWAVMPCHFVGGLIQAKSAKGFSSGSSAAYSELVALASESASNIKTIASFCQEDHVIMKAKVTLKKPLTQSRKQSVKYGIIQGVSLCLWNIAHAVALWYTTILVERGQASFEDGIRSYQIFSLTVPSITELWTLIPTVFSAISILTPVFQTLDRQTEIEPDSPKQSPHKSIKGEIEFQNVNFFYPSRAEVTVLDDFSLKIEAGSKVALVGPSGAGKSSVLALLLRFYDVNGGEVLIDGKDIKRYNLRKLRTQIGLVQQEPLLFSCSIRDNICYGNEGASEAEIIQAAMDANIHEVISNLPRGYDTSVGEKGCQLSGGQKQRIAIARVLLKKPSIMLLDEATSALDAESERAIISALESLKLRATHVTVAHRLSTVINSDTIIVMDKGKVVEMGTHAALLAAEGVYSRLSRLQTVSEN